MIVTGAVATAAGPHSGGEDIRRLGIPVRTPCTSTCAPAPCSASASSWSARGSSATVRRAPGVARLALLLLGGARRQMILGEIQYRNAIPWGLVLVHVFLSATIWTLMLGARRGRLAPAVAARRSAARAGAGAGHRARPQRAETAGRQPEAPPRKLSDGRRAPHRRAALAATPDPHRRLQGVERRRAGCEHGGRAPRRRLGCEALRGDRPGGVRRLPVRHARRSSLDGGSDAAGSSGPRTCSTTPPSRVSTATRSSFSASSRATAGGRSRRSSPALPQELGVELVVTMGALLADVPHTRPSPVTGAASDPALVEELGLQLSRYEGPTGIVGVLHDGFHRAGVGSVSLWAAVPHYVSLAPSPRAARALCERLGDLLGIPIDVEELAPARTSTPPRCRRPSPRTPRPSPTSRSWSAGPTRSSC